jgi:signal transduction histidine kinase
MEAPKRVGPALVVGLVVLFAALSVSYAWVVAGHLRREASQTSRLFGRVFAALNDTSASETDVLLELAQDVRGLGVPLVVLDAGGSVVAADNLPFSADLPRDSARVRAFAAELDRSNPPIRQTGLGEIHYGQVPIAGSLTLLVSIQLAAFALLVALAVWAYRTRIRASREQLWAAMAREAAHQLGTPLMSLTGWIQYLRDNPGTPASAVADHLAADGDRLDRVAKRFERIGRPSRLEPVGLGAVSERVIEYFRPRLPRLAHPVRLTLAASGPGPVVLGDPVLLEWAVEALVRNAIDALSGRGGSIQVEVGEQTSAGSAGGQAVIRVADDGPGVPETVRRDLFEPGVSTKAGGWGMGLALAKRIVTDQHGGRLQLERGAPGAVFTIVLPLNQGPKR